MRVHSRTPPLCRFRAIVLGVCVFIIFMWLRKRRSATDPSRLPTTVAQGAGGRTYLHRAPPPLTPSLLGALPFFPSRHPRVSPWHGLPLRDGGRARATALLARDDVVTFVCEVPHGGTAKFEVQLGVPLNPLAQDVDKGGAPRFYPWRSLLNYGMLPQTYEDPTVGGAGGVARPGDGDPLDAMDLWPLPARPERHIALAW